MHNTSPVSPKTPAQQSAAFTHQAEAPVEAVAPGIKRQFLGYNDELMAVRVWFDEGAEGPLHNHPHTQVVLVEKGRFDVTVGEETRSLSAGDSFFVAPHVMHGAICRQAGILIDMFSPVREDFLAESDIL